MNTLKNQQENINNKKKQLWDRLLKVSKYNYSREKGHKVGSFVEKEYFYFEGEEVLNYLRQLYTSTSNQFVKKVLITVGKSRKFSEKQIDIIINEGCKFNLNINF